MDPKSTKEFEDAVKYDMDGDGDYDADDHGSPFSAISVKKKGCRSHSRRFAGKNARQFVINSHFFPQRRKGNRTTWRLCALAGERSDMT